MTSLWVWTNIDRLLTSVLMWSRRIALRESSTCWLRSSTRFNKFQAKLRTADIIASEAVLTVRIEKILGTRLSSLCNNRNIVGLLLIATKHEKSELGFSLLEPSCLKLSIKGFTDLKKISQKSEPKSWESYLLSTTEIIFKHTDLASLYCLIDMLLCKTTPSMLGISCLPQWTDRKLHK